MTTPLALAEICDLDCVVSRDPLELDLAATERYVVGAEAVAQRVLVAWAQDARILDLEGTISDRERFVLRARLAALAEGVEFVSRVAVTVAAVDGSGALAISATLYLDDDTTAQLEVTTGAAATLDFEVLE